METLSIAQFFKDWTPVINLVLIPIAMAAVSGIRKIRVNDLANIARKFDALIVELRDVKLQIAALESRVARLEGIAMTLVRSGERGERGPTGETGAAGAAGTARIEVKV